MASKLREAVLALQDRRYEDVRVPEWNGATVRVAEINAEQRVEYTKIVVSQPARAEEKTLSPEWYDWLQRVRLYLLLHSLVDPESWEPLFESTAEVGARSERVLNPLYDVAVRVSALSQKSAETVKGE